MPLCYFVVFSVPRVLPHLSGAGENVPVKQFQILRSSVDLKFWRALEGLIGAGHFKANHVLSVPKQLYLARYRSETLEK